MPLIDYRNRKMTYDQKCFDLAADFLGDFPELNDRGYIEDLAGLIQLTVEDYISSSLEEMVSEQINAEGRA